MKKLWKTVKHKYPYFYFEKISFISLSRHGYGSLDALSRGSEILHSNLFDYTQQD
jgi:hypothetical protein